MISGGLAYRVTFYVHPIFQVIAVYYDNSDINKICEIMKVLFLAVDNKSIRINSYS